MNAVAPTYERYEDEPIVDIRTTGKRNGVDPQARFLEDHIPLIPIMSLIAGLGQQPIGAIISIYAVRFYAETGATLRVKVGRPQNGPVEIHGLNTSSIELIIDPDASPHEVWPVFFYYTSLIAHLHGRTGYNIIPNTDPHGIGPLGIQGETTIEGINQGLRKKTSMENILTVLQMSDIVRREVGGVTHLEAHVLKTAGQSLQAAHQHWHINIPETRRTPRIEGQLGRTINKPQLNGQYLAGLVCEICVGLLEETAELFKYLIRESGTPLQTAFQQTWATIESIISKHATNPSCTDYQAIVTELTEKDLMSEFIDLLNTSDFVIKKAEKKSKAEDLSAKIKTFKSLKKSLSQMVHGDERTLPLEKKTKTLSQQKIALPKTRLVFPYALLTKYKSVLEIVFRETITQIAAEEAAPEDDFADIELFIETEIIQKGMIPRLRIKMPNDKWLQYGDRVPEAVTGTLNTIWGQIYDQATQVAANAAANTDDIENSFQLKTALNTLQVQGISFEEEPGVIGAKKAQKVAANVDQATANYLNFFLLCFRNDAIDLRLHHRNSCPRIERFDPGPTTSSLTITPTFVHEPISDVASFTHAVCEPGLFKERCDDRTRQIGNMVVKVFGAEALDDQEEEGKTHITWTRRQKRYRKAGFTIEERYDATKNEEDFLYDLFRKLEAKFSTAGTEKYYLWFYTKRHLVKLLENEKSSEVKQSTLRLFHDISKDTNSFAKYLDKSHDREIGVALKKGKANTKAIRNVKKALALGREERLAAFKSLERDRLSYSQIMGIIGEMQNKMKAAIPQEILANLDQNGLQTYYIAYVEHLIVGLISDEEGDANYLSKTEKKERHITGEFIPRHPDGQEKPIQISPIIERFNKQMVLNGLALYILNTSFNHQLTNRLKMHDSSSEDKDAAPFVMLSTMVSILEKITTPEQVIAALEQNDTGFFQKLLILEEPRPTSEKVTIPEHIASVGFCDERYFEAEKQPSKKARSADPAIQGHAETFKQCPIDIGEIKKFISYSKSMTDLHVTQTSIFQEVHRLIKETIGNINRPF